MKLWLPSTLVCIVLPTLVDAKAVESVTDTYINMQPVSIKIINHTSTKLGIKFAAQDPSSKQGTFIAAPASE